MDDLVDRLRALKNGVVERDLIIEEAATELASLRHWKAEAMLVLAEWEQVWEEAGRPGRLGTSKAAGVAAGLASLRTLKAKVDALGVWHGQGGSQIMYADGRGFEWPLDLLAWLWEPTDG